MKLGLKIKRYYGTRFDLTLSVYRRWKASRKWTDHPTYRHWSVYVSLLPVACLRGFGGRRYWAATWLFGLRGGRSSGTRHLHLGPLGCSWPAR